MVKPTLVSQLAQSIIDDCKEIEKDVTAYMPIEFGLRQAGIYDSLSELAANGMADTVGMMMLGASKPSEEIFDLYARILSVKKGSKQSPEDARNSIKGIIEKVKAGFPPVLTETGGAPVFLQVLMRGVPSGAPSLAHEKVQNIVEKWATLLEAVSELDVVKGDPQLGGMMLAVQDTLDSVVEQINQRKYITSNRNLFRPAPVKPTDKDGNAKPGTKITPVDDKTVANNVKVFSSKPELEKYQEEFKGKNDPYIESAGDSLKGKDAMKELERLIGLEEVKDEIKKLRALMLMHAAKKKMGVLKDGHEHAMHLVFTGNPGTGKTTVARLVGQMYKDLGILEKGHVVSVGRQDLVAGYIGQSEEKTKKKIEEAMGGVLFIDEAYALKRGGDDGKDFGNNVIDVLIQAMEDHRDELVVIVAGYPEPMKRFISSNPGLESRFNKYIDFKNYTGPELGQIFDLMLSDRGMTITPDARDAAVDIFTQESQRANEKFGNGRFVRNFVEKLEQEQAMRISDEGKINRKIANDDKLSPETHPHLLTIELDDVKAVKMKSILKDGSSVKTGPGAIQIVQKPKP